MRTHKLTAKGRLKYQRNRKENFEKIDLKNLPSDLDEETHKAQELAETMKILYAASYSGRATGIELEDISNGLFLFWRMFEEHTERLNKLTGRAYSIK